MRVLLDHNIPAQLAPLLRGHEVLSARELRWDRLRNGDLLAAGEKNGFAVMITGDQSIVYQQNNATRLISLVVVTNTKRSVLLSFAGEVCEALMRVVPESFELMALPHSGLSKFR